MRDTADDVILILGGGGHASDVVSILEACGENAQIVVADDRRPNADRFAGRQAELSLGISEQLLPGRRFIVGVGYPAPRRALVQKALAEGLKPAAALLHPTSVLATGSSVGSGSVVGALSFLSALSEVSEHSYIGYGAKIGHDSFIGDFASVMPGSFIGGDCTVAEGALIGANATVHQGLTIGSWAVVGAGAVVLTDVPAGATVVGNPARVVKSRT